ncbi:unannotated protein [freshwater metagenome]|uniref:Unannotated protein n=1 Tax=freshwater metagenome TaxID=449393 RepID=A0A6J6FA93_9ZZZZ|nr:DUF418 domain-containing protein [Actinomycetota bacterium]
MQREIIPDVLRGFALLGILIVNIQFMALSSAEGARGEWTVGLANGSATFIIAAIFAGKFYLIFSFLFGYSSNYIIRENKANRKRWIKRSILLIFIGVLHFTFLWHGDILFVYGLFGLLLTPFFFRTDRTLKIWSRVIFSISFLLVCLIGALVYIGERYFPEESFQTPLETKLDQVLLDGSFLQAVPARLELWVYGVSSGVFLQGGLAFAAFLMGVRMARSKFLSTSFDKEVNTKLMKKGLFFGLPIQILAAIVLVQNENKAEPSEAIYLISLFTSFMAAPLLSIFYIALIRKLVSDKPNLLSWIGPAGKMSLTVYILQSVITSLIFGPWGFGLFQQLQTWMVLLLAVGIWLILVYFATTWLKRYKQGPLEWLVNVITKERKDLSSAT